MDTQKLYMVAQDILDEMNSREMSTHLANLYSFVVQNTSEGYENATATRKLLDDIFANSITYTYSPTYLEIVELLGAMEFVGVGGESALNGVLDGSALQLSTSLEKYINEFSELKAKLQQLTTSLSAIGIEPYRFGLYEIGYIIPAELNDLNDITKRLTHYNKFLSVISTIAGEQDNTIHLSRLSNGSLEFFVLQGVAVAKIVDIVLKRVVELYREIQKVKKASADIDKVNADTLKSKTESLASLVALQKEMSDSFVGNTVEQVMKGYKGEAEAKGEIASQLGMTIKLLLKDIQNGIKVEISPPDQESDEESKDFPSTVVDVLATNLGLIKLYSKSKEQLKLPSEFDATPAEEKQMEKTILVSAKKTNQNNVAKVKPDAIDKIKKPKNST